MEKENKLDDEASCLKFKVDCEKSKKNTLRGMHYQLPPMTQGKLVSVLEGVIFDVVVDLRSSSKTFGNYIFQKLDSITKQQLWVPEGFAHGFLVTSDFAEVMYKTTNFYSPNYERSIIWSDPIFFTTSYNFGFWKNKF